MFVFFSIFHWDFAGVFYIGYLASFCPFIFSTNNPFIYGNNTDVPFNVWITLFCNGFDLPHMASKCQRFHAAITSFALHQRLNVPRMKKINYAIYCHLIKLGIIMFHRVTLLQQSIIYVHHTILLFFFVGTELHSRWKLSREILSSN